MAKGWGDFEEGDRVVYQPPSAKRSIEGVVVELYSSDKNRCKIRMDDGQEKDVVCEFCEKV